MTVTTWEAIVSAIGGLAVMALARLGPKAIAAADAWLTARTAGEPPSAIEPPASP